MVWERIKRSLGLSYIRKAIRLGWDFATTRIKARALGIAYRVRDMARDWMNYRRAYMSAVALEDIHPDWVIPPRFWQRGLIRPKYPYLIRGRAVVWNEVEKRKEFYFISIGLDRRVSQTSIKERVNKFFMERFHISLLTFIDFEISELWRRE